MFKDIFRLNFWGWDISLNLFFIDMHRQPVNPWYQPGYEPSIMFSNWQYGINNLFNWNYSPRVLQTMAGTCLMTPVGDPWFPCDSNIPISQMPGIRQERTGQSPALFRHGKGNSVPGHRYPGWLQQSTHPYHSNPRFQQRGLRSMRDDWQHGQSGINMQEIYSRYTCYSCRAEERRSKMDGIGDQYGASDPEKKIWDIADWCIWFI